MASDAPTIRVEDVTVAYRGAGPAIEGVTFGLRGPTICALLGMNGSGKSTLFKAVMGFVRPQAGHVAIDGRDVAWAQRANAVAYVPQTEEVDWSFPVSVRDVVTMGRQGRMGFLRIPSATDRRIVGESLERVGMAGFAERQIGELSGGQKKRVFLARALAQEARIVLLDEPFTGVDLRTEAAITGILRGLRDAGGLILVSTHNIASVPDYCDEAILVNRRLVAAGPLATAFTPGNLDRAFGGAVRIVPGPEPAGEPGATLPALAAS